MSRALIEACAARIEAELGANRVVYRFAVPDGELPPRYLLVTSNIGESLAQNMAAAEDARQPVLWVSSVSRHPKPQLAVQEAMWGAERARDALIGWRPQIGRAAWKPVHESSSPVRRDEDLPDAAVMFTVDQFRITYQP